MRVPITVPDLEFAAEPLRLGEWAVERGDHVFAGECLTEIICPGLTIDLTAPATGIVAELSRQPEQSIATGDVLGWIESSE